MEAAELERLETDAEVGTALCHGYLAASKAVVGRCQVEDGRTRPRSAGVGVEVGNELLRGCLSVPDGQEKVREPVKATVFDLACGTSEQAGPGKAVGGVSEGMEMAAKGGEPGHCTGREVEDAAALCDVEFLDVMVWPMGLAAVQGFECATATAGDEVGASAVDEAEAASDVPEKRTR